MAPAVRRAASAEADVRAREQVIDEVRLLWNALVRRGEQLHAAEGLTMGMRAVLEFLLRNGDTTVPDMARSRGVSRQQIQSLVNPLLEQGLVRTVANPAHRRSALIQLTGRGSQTIRRMRRREAQAFFRGDTDLDAAELERTAASLRAIRRSLARPGS